MNNIDCERIQHSYIKLPESFKYGKCQGREDDDICKKELNDKYIGVPPYLTGSKQSILSNTSKVILLNVTVCIM